MVLVVTGEKLVHSHLASAAAEALNEEALNEASAAVHYFFCRNEAGLEPAPPDLYELRTRLFIRFRNCF